MKGIKNWVKVTVLDFQGKAGNEGNGSFWVQN